MRQFKQNKQMSRLEKAAATSKQAREKLSRQQRGGRGGQIVSVAESLTMAKGSQGYITEADRFRKDFAAEEKRKRDAKLSLEQMRTERKRYEQASADDVRWKKHEAENRENDLKVQRWREDGAKAKRNKSSVPYNVLTLDYHHSDDGQRLRQADMAIRKRAETRRILLKARRSNQEHDILTHTPNETFSMVLADMAEQQE